MDTKLVDKLVVTPLEPIAECISGILYYVFQKPIEFKAIEKANVKALSESVVKDTLKTPYDQLSTANSGLAIKAFEDSKYSLNSEILRNYFSKLIANSFKKNFNNVIAPYFSTILANLSEKDAVFIARFQDNLFLPTMRLGYQIKNGGQITFDTHKYMIDKELSVNSFSKEISTLLSLGLIEESWHQFHPEFNKQYDIIQEYMTSDKNINLLKSENELFTNEIQVFSGTINITELGKSFLNCVM